MSQLRRLLPSLNALVAFEAVMRRGTFAEAARELGVTGPAVSRTIGRLEKHLGLSLFGRTPTGAVPTREGNELFSGISRSFGEIESTLTRLKQLAQPQRRPTVLSVSSAFATHWFMPRLTRFQACFPDEQVHFDMISGPLGGPARDADIAMRFDHRPEPGEHVELLMPELILPVGAPQCVARAGAVETLPSGVPRLITLDGSHPDWAWLAAHAVIPPCHRELRFADYSLVLQAALVGQGIALGWLNVVSQLLVRGELVPASTRVITTGRRCELVIQRNMVSSVIGDIRNWIMGEVAEDLRQLRTAYPQLSNSIAGAQDFRPQGVSA